MVYIARFNRVGTIGVVIIAIKVLKTCCVGGWIYYWGHLLVGVRLKLC